VVMPFGGRTVRVSREGSAVRFSVLDAAFPLVERVEVSILDLGAGAEGRAAELRDALWQQLGLVLRYRGIVDGREGGRSLMVRERLAERLRDVTDDQADLLAAVRAGADGFSALASRDRDPAERTPAERASRPAGGALEVVLGQH
jgi:hypothetical protein